MFGEYRHNVLYFVINKANALTLYDINTRKFIDSIKLPNQYNEAACIAVSNNEIIYIVFARSMRIYSNNSWILSDNILNINREHHACGIKNEIMYIYGGINTANIERISLPSASEATIVASVLSGNIDCQTINNDIITYLYHCYFDDGTISRDIQIYNTETDLITLKPYTPQSKLFIFNFDTELLEPIHSRNAQRKLLTVPTKNPTYGPTWWPTRKPTLRPTRIPTESPSRQPTIAPTRSTNSPSIPPTTSPTLDPSLSPTIPPTLNPTRSTEAPSTSPTENPTLLPTNNPTLSTVAPTRSPTICDFYDDYNITFNESNIQLGFADNSLQSIQTSVTDFLGFDINCNNATGCEYKCDAVAACLQTVFVIDDYSTNIECSERVSCFGTNIVSNLNDTNATVDVDIICNDVQSCQQMVINLQYINNFYLKCFGEDSCSGLRVTLSNVTNAIISCYNQDVCDSLYITTDTPLTTVLMLYENSNNIIIDNGYGYEPNVNFFCNRDQKLIQLTSNSNATTILSLIKLEYKNTVNIPCDGVTFLCVGTSFCTMKLVGLTLNDISANITDTNDNCLLISAEDISELQCDNDDATLQCLNSPTPPPTHSPTPAPSNAPTWSPSPAPTFSPTIPPTPSPTLSPTPGPTFDPTLVPSRAPSKSPTTKPSISPSLPPTLSPSNDPTIEPTMEPTKSPTPAPSSAPTFSPTNSPTTGPTPAPSDSPTPVPSFAPSSSPTAAPTLSPTEPPTFNPTSSDWVFTAFMEVQYYILQKLTYDNVVYIINDNTLSSTKYQGLNIANEPKVIFQTELAHAFYDPQFTHDSFEVVFHNVSFSNPTDAIQVLSQSDVDNLSIELLFNVEVRFDKEDIGFLRIEAVSDEFLARMTERIRLRLSNDRATFGITGGSSSLNIQEVIVIDETSDDLLIFLISWISLMVVISILAFASQKGAFKKCRSAIADETQYFSILVLGIQVWDLVSDLYLSFEILDVYNLKRESIFGYLFVASMFFSVMPYLANLAIAANIRKYDAVQKNVAATSYMNQRSALFVILTVITGGSHPALAVLSSNVFGLEIFTTGLTKYELNRLQKIKIFSTIILDNLPQIGIQFWYSDLIEEFTSTARLAFSASILSVVATILTSIVSRESNFNGSHVSYYLSFSNSAGHRSRSMSTTRKHSSHHIEALQKIRQHRWQRNILTERLTKVLQIPKTNVEIGYVFLTNNGCIVHIIHAVSKTQLEELKTEIHQRLWARITPIFYVQQLYLLHKDEVTDVFQEHFELENTDKLEQKYDEYTVKWSRTYPKNVTKSKRDMLKKKGKLLSTKKRHAFNDNSNQRIVDVIKELFMANNTNNNDSLFNDFMKEKELEFLLHGNNINNSARESSLLSGMFKSKNEPSRQVEMMIELHRTELQAIKSDDDGDGDGLETKGNPLMIEESKEHEHSLTLSNDDNKNISIDMTQDLYETSKNEQRSSYNAVAAIKLALKKFKTRMNVGMNNDTFIADETHNDDSSEFTAEAKVAVSAVSHRNIMDVKRFKTRKNVIDNRAHKKSIGSQKTFEMKLNDETDIKVQETMLINEIKRIETELETKNNEDIPDDKKERLHHEMDIAALKDNLHMCIIFCFFIYIIINISFII